MTARRQLAFTKHAQDRLAQRGFSKNDVVYIMNRGHHELDDDGSWQAVAGLRGRDARVVYERTGDGALVVTVMWVDE